MVLGCWLKLRVFEFCELNEDKMSFKVIIKGVNESIVRLFLYE